MKFNFLNKLFKKNNNEDKEDNKEFVNRVPSSNSVDNNINIEHNDYLIKIEIKKDCTLQEYCNETESLLKENLANMDDAMIDMINRIPMRMLISNGIKTINGQTIYLIRNDDFEYIISSNAKNIHISESRMVDEEIEESTIQIYFPNGEYKISKYIHDINRSTKSVKFYKTSNVSNQLFSIDKEEASSTVKSMLQHLEENESIKNILDLEHISSYLNAIEVTDVPETEDNMKNIDEKNNEQLEY